MNIFLKVINHALPSRYIQVSKLHGHYDFGYYKRHTLKQELKLPGSL